MNVPMANIRIEHSKALKTSFVKSMLKSRGQEYRLKRLYLSIQYCIVKMTMSIMTAAGAITAKNETKNTIDT